MNKLKVAFVDFWPELDDENIFLPILKKYFEIEITPNNPDVVIHSIYQGFKETPKYNKSKKILFLGENYRPNRFGSDFSISFDPHSEKNYQLPLWQFYLILRPELKDKLFNRIIHKEFDRFCSFVVSNSGNFVRNGFFEQMKAAGQISSYGRYLTNNSELQQTSKGRYWRDAKNEFFERVKHKYAITFENNSYPFYNTEKIMDGFLGGSLPLYWGDPKINDNFNPDAFINVGKLGTSETVKLVQEMETNVDLFNIKYNAPIFTDEQKSRHIENIEKFESWFIDVINK